MNTTLQDLLHAINIIGEDRDVLVDGLGEIAVCPPVRITRAGRKHFAQALTANVVVDYDKNDNHECTYVCDDDEKITEMAHSLLTSLAGYCYVDGFDQWFEGEDAEIL